MLDKYKRFGYPEVSRGFIKAPEAVKPVDQLPLRC